MFPLNETITQRVNAQLVILVPADIVFTVEINCVKRSRNRVIIVNLIELGLITRLLDAFTLQISRCELAKIALVGSAETLQKIVSVRLADCHCRDGGTEQNLEFHYIFNFVSDPSKRSMRSF